MTTKLTPIKIDGTCWPNILNTTKPQKKKFQYSDALSDGINPSSACQIFGVSLSRSHYDTQSPAKSSISMKYQFLILGIVILVCMLLMAGRAFANGERQEAKTALTVQSTSLKEKNMQSDIYENSNVLAETPMGVPHITNASTQVEARHTASAVIDSNIKQLGQNANLDSLSHNVSNSATPIAVSETPRTNANDIVIAVAALTLACGAGIAIERCRYSVSTHDTTTRQCSNGTSDTYTRHFVQAIKPLCGSLYIEPYEMLSLMRCTHPKLRIAEAYGTFAIRSVTGHNSENQDYSLAFDLSTPTLGPVQVTFIADGCGGHFGGRDAAYTAVSACADHLLKSSERKLIDVAKNCLEAAKKHIASVGTRYWGPNDFRCTLIVLLANKTEYALAHIGDGGADVRRDDGTWQRLITPQRDEHTGYLTGSLGPIPYGNYASMSIQRMQGDFLVAGSDGIYVDEIINLEEFWKWPRDAFNNAHVDLGTVLNTYIAECLQRFPNIFDDNVTALVLTTPKSSKSSSIIAKQSTTSQIYSAMSKYYRKMAE